MPALGKGKEVAKQFKKYTLEPTGIWARIHKIFAVDPNRSSGVPLNPQFRNPPPGSNDPREYDDPVTLPAGDIAENPYWKRDNRRRYERTSVIGQGDVVGLLTVGSAAAPNESVLKIGDAGKQQLIAVKEEGQKGLAAFFEKEKDAAKSVLGPDGLPPMAPSLRDTTADGVKRYTLLEEQTYEDNYPCRTFA